MILYGLFTITLAYYPFNTAFMSLNRTDILARIYLITLICNTSSAIILIPTYGIYGAISSLAIGSLSSVISSKHYLEREGINIPLTPKARDISELIHYIKQKRI